MKTILSNITKKLNDYIEKEEIRKQIMESLKWMETAYGGERDYDFDSKYKLVEINKINQYLAYEVRIEMIDSYKAIDRYYIFFAMNDTYSVVKVNELNATAEGLENVERYIKSIEDELEDCISREDCKLRMNSLIKDKNQESEEMNMQQHYKLVKEMMRKYREISRNYQH